MTQSNDQAHGADRLWALRDEIRLKIHLGGMDAKDEWRVIERELEQIQERVGHAADDIADEVRRAIQRLEPLLMKLGQTGI